MEEQEKKQERGFELRSEKVRSIVGQIPSSLVRYGITAIGTVLLCLFVVAYFLPYKQVYSGVAIVHEIETSASADSVETTITLKFDSRHPDVRSCHSIFLQTANRVVSGRLLHLAAMRDTPERREALCRFRTDEIKAAEHQAVDFRMVQSSGSILKHIMGVHQVNISPI